MKNFFVRNKWLWFVLLGVVNALPFTFEKLFFISWFTLTPFFVLLIKLFAVETPFKKLFLYVFLFFFSFHFGIYHFFMALVPMSMVGLGVISSFVVLLFAWIFLSAVHSITHTIIFSLVLKLKVNTVFKILSLSLAFVLVQYVQSLGAYGFTWARISLPQSAFLPLIQSASILGPYFVDLLLLLINAFFAIAFLSDRKYVFCGTALTVFLANLIFGFVYMQKEFESVGEKDVSIVQGNVLTDEKWTGSSSYSVYMAETLSLEKTDSLVVWTETAIPTHLNDSKKILSELEAYTVESGNEMIVGAFYCTKMGRELNGAYYVSEGEVSDTVYFKRRLVPFGEFLPFRRLLSSVSFLDGLNLFSSDLFSGHSTYVMDTEGGKVGNLICFDSIFHYLARESTNDGAELLVIITNDAWYKDFPAVYQHNNQAKWRSVENGRYVVRAANSGVSSVISPHGEVLSSLPPLVKGTLSEKVYFIEDKTVYTQIGDIIIVPILAFLVLCILISIKKSFIRVNRK